MEKTFTILIGAVSHQSESESGSEKLPNSSDDNVIFGSTMSTTMDGTIRIPIKHPFSSVRPFNGTF